MTIADFFKKELNYLREGKYRRAIINGVAEPVFKLYPESLFAQNETPIWDIPDWDIALILDGCRTDTFREFYPSASSYFSVASSSEPWISQTFDRETGGLAYVSGNPYTEYAHGVAYVHQEPVRRTGYGITTVPPQRLAEHAIAAWHHRDELGVDRMVIHFMQPHVPFRTRPEWFRNYRQESADWGSALWDEIGYSITRDDWMAAYRDNLQWVITRGVEPIQTGVDAEVLVTADHGNAIGEFGFYGHPEKIPIRAVRQVPLLRVTATNERGLHPPLPDQNERVDRETQLEALGYA